MPLPHSTEGDTQGNPWAAQIMNTTFLDLHRNGGGRDFCPSGLRQLYSQEGDLIVSVLHWGTQDKFSSEAGLEDVWVSPPMPRRKSLCLLIIHFNSRQEETRLQGEMLTDFKNFPQRWVISFVSLSLLEELDFGFPRFNHHFQSTPLKHPRGLWNPQVNRTPGSMLFCSQNFYLSKWIRLLSQNHTALIELYTEKKIL